MQTYQDMDRIENEKEALGDSIDLFSMASRVHSKLTDMTRDYTLAKYTSQHINDKFPKFVREQRKVLRIVKTFLVIPVDRLKDKYDDKFAKFVFAKLNVYFDQINELIGGEVDEMAIMSRTDQGQIIKGVLMYNKPQEDREKFDEEVGKESPKPRIMERFTQRDKK